MISLLTVKGNVRSLISASLFSNYDCLSSASCLSTSILTFSSSFSSHEEMVRMFRVVSTVWGANVISL